MSYQFLSFFDGSCVNDGTGTSDIGIGVVVYEVEDYKLLNIGRQSKSTCSKSKIINKQSFFLSAQEYGSKTSNNVAEYYAFRRAFETLQVICPEHSEVFIFGDSDLVVKQMNGLWKIKEGDYYKEAVRAKQVFKENSSQFKIQLNWIPRELNHVADKLSNPNRK